MSAIVCVLCINGAYQYICRSQENTSVTNSVALRWVERRLFWNSKGKGASDFMAFLIQSHPFCFLFCNRMPQRMYEIYLFCFPCSEISQRWRRWYTNDISPVDENAKHAVQMAEYLCLQLLFCSRSFTTQSYHTHMHEQKYMWEHIYSKRETKKREPRAWQSQVVLYVCLYIQNWLFYIPGC